MPLEFQTFPAYASKKSREIVLSLTIPSQRSLQKVCVSSSTGQRLIGALKVGASVVQCLWRRLFQRVSLSSPSARFYGSQKELLFLRNVKTRVRHRKPRLWTRRFNRARFRSSDSFAINVQALLGEERNLVIIPAVIVYMVAYGPKVLRSIFPVWTIGSQNFFWFPSIHWVWWKSISV